jgi:hypothetical protein
MAPDDVKDSFYLRAMRSGIGAALRERYAVNEPLTERLAKLLKELDGTQAQPQGAAENAPSPSEPFTKKQAPEA